MSADTLFYNLINNKYLGRTHMNAYRSLEEVEEMIIIATECLIYSRHCSKCFSCINSYKPQNKCMR